MSFPAAGGSNRYGTNHCHEHISLDGPFADKLNGMPKYVLSTTLERADWTDSTILRGDLVTEVTRLA
jgi:hypothetical protein